MVTERDEKKILVQDDRREIELAALLRLTHMARRLGHDAEDEFGNPFELKTTTMSGFGTGRDVSLEMIAQWRRRYWVFAKGQNLVSGFRSEELYFLSPSMLDGWFSGLENRFKHNSELRDIVISKMKRAVSKEDLDQIEYLINRGMTYNNPHIPMEYIRNHGVKLDPRTAANDLPKLVKANPLRQ